MEIALSIFFLLALLVQIVLLIFTARRPTAWRWICLFAVEIAAIAAALLLWAHFNALSGTGIMPGLTHFAETVFSLTAAAASCVMLLISALCALIIVIRRKHSH